MQLLCNGVILDLYDNAGLQFTHENPLFAFDDLKCERTTNFKLPATPTNDRVFSLAKIPAYSGEGMRRKFPCQLQAGAVVRDGYLYVANFDGKDYNAVFVTGELVGLQRIKDLGKLADIADWAWGIRSGYNVYNASAETFKTFMFSAYRYHTPTGVSVLPSINLGKLAEYACAQNNVPVTIPAKAYNMRIALAELKTPEDATAHIFSQKEPSDDWYNSIEPDGFIKYLTENHGLVALKTITYHRGHSNPQGEVLQTDETRKMVEHYRCPNDISITFPEDFPDNYFLVYMNPLVTGQCVFLGDYSFTRSISGMGEGTYTTTGEPLAGRTIDIPANTSFILVRTIVEGDVSKSDYACRAENTYIYIDDEPVAVTAVTRGWEFAQADALAYDIEVQVSTLSENAGGWRLQENLPDITLTELLKAIAAELGYILNYTEADGIIFDTIDTDAVTVKSLDTLTKKGEVVRKFGKYAQHNYVQFADDEQFQNVQFTAVDYTIDNDNISNDKTLLKLPWTCGVQDAQYVRDKAGRTKPLEIRFNPDEFGIYALFAKIEKNADIQNLCDQSTQIKIETRMPLLQYDAIKPKTGLLVDGSTYLWTERSWQKDVAKMTLAQFGKAIVPTPPVPPHYNFMRFNNYDGIFDTGITPTFNTSMEAQFIIYNGIGNDNLLVGCENSLWSYRFMIWIYNNRIQAGKTSAPGQYTMSTLDNAYGNVITIKVENYAAVAKMNGQEITTHYTTLSPFANTQHIFIGTGGRNDSYEVPSFKGDFFYLKIWEGDQLIADWRAYANNKFVNLVNGDIITNLFPNGNTIAMN